jgi:hypothetical protein
MRLDAARRIVASFAPYGVTSLSNGSFVVTSNKLVLKEDGESLPVLGVLSRIDFAAAMQRVLSAPYK